jgi:hypothetical protein
MPLRIKVHVHAFLNSALDGLMMTVISQLLYSQGKSPWYQFDKALDRPQKWSGHCEQKRFYLWHILNPESLLIQPAT